ncbi:MAG: arginyltransferase [Sulfuriferula sp.]|nr:arginyltransferase [Sulfuriferula sp.]
MTRLHEIPIQLQFYITSPYTCSYLPEQMARSQVATPAHLVDTAVYSELIRIGFRRSGLYTYRPQCGECQACVPVRVLVDEFSPNRTQRRALKMNAGMTVSIETPHFDDEHFALYQRYQAARHAGGGMDHDDREQYTHFLVAGLVTSYLLVFRDEGVVQMVSLIDHLADGLSAVYTFFNPDLPKRSLGVFNVLWQIHLARQFHLPYLYLGYWVADSRKMAYKQQYQPLQGFIDADWRTYTTAQT